MENEHDHHQMAEDEIGKKIESWLERKFSGKVDKDCKCGHYHKHKWHKRKSGAGAGIYCVGFVGAAVYYIGIATSFGVGVVGVLKAIVWPAFLVHGLLTYIGL